MLDELWREGFAYAKAGVMLSDLYAPGQWQTDLFAKPCDTVRSDALMQVMDQINGQGRGRVWLASQGIHKPWAMKRGRLSPAYTTCWSDLLRVY